MKPEFWRDRTVAMLPAATRLTYVGLWMLADDDGWFRYDPPLIALELFGWDPVDEREAVVAQALELLHMYGRIVISECGKHGIVPALTKHQRFAGETKKVYTFKREHERCPHPSRQSPAGAPQVPATVSGEVRNVSVRQVSSDARKREDDEPSEFQRLVDRKVALG